MPQGQIKKLVSDKGFGFIKDDHGGEVFFHASGLEGVSFEELSEGQTVEFRTEQGPKGPRAASVRLVE
jgi:CspA family cold shock protein